MLKAKRAEAERHQQQIGAGQLLAVLGEFAEFTGGMDFVDPMGDRPRNRSGARS